MMLSYVPTAPTLESRILDVILGAVTIFGSHWEAGAGAIVAENEALAWLANLCGFAPSAGGCFVSGGSAANLSALVAARYQWRQSRGREHRHRLKLALTAESHASLAAAAHVMDIDLVGIPTDRSGRMDTSYLGQVLEADKHSPAIFGIVATGGTTSLGIVDDISAVADLCGTYSTWLHVDAAYGGPALCVPHTRPLFNGIDRADSVTIDPHKWFFAPYDCAALIYRNPSIAAAAHTQRADHLDSVDSSRWNPADYAFHLSRRARGLPFWFSLAANGTDAYRRSIESTLAVARDFATRIDDRPYLTLHSQPMLTVVLFQRNGWQHDDYVNWSSALASEGRALITPFVRNGLTYARLCIVNPLTTLEELDRVLDSMA